MRRFVTLTVSSCAWGPFVKESRKHYDQLEEARKQQHAKKLKLEAQEVALGERDRVTAGLGDSLFMGETTRVRRETCSVEKKKLHRLNFFPRFLTAFPLS